MQSKQITELLKLIGLSIKEIGRRVEKSDTTVKSVLLGQNENFYSPETAKAIWLEVEKEAKARQSQIKPFLPLVTAQLKRYQKAA